ncbi:MAG: HD domain-containing protein [Polyangiaceae bacterium]
MILRDPVHGLVSFEAEEEAVLPRLFAAREVQRLRRIRQLGLASLAFPGAEHTRFAHAIGAATVMQRLLARLRQIDHELPFWQRVTSERARDALAAAFLHDVGHGPLSHLFEEALPDAQHHEAWTDRILLDPSTDVHKVLVSQDAHLPKRVADLVHGRHDLPYLSKAVSGTVDVDRADYLLRDAHATGVRYGEYDLPWLMRSLRFANSSTDAAPTLAIDGIKGVSALESFVLARYFMFQQVYFHKSGRAAEHMVKRILERAIALVRDGVRLPSLPPAFLSVAAGEQPTLGEYLDLDDQVLLLAIHAWEQAGDPTLADLCKRLRAREIWKTIDLHDADEAAKAEALGRARDIAKTAGLDPDVYVALDVAEDTPYKDDGSLLVAFRRGRARRPTEVSVVLERLDGATCARTRIVFPAELRPQMLEAIAQ